MQAYCVKCRAKREMKDAKAITMENGKPATQGTCPTCGTKMFRVGKKLNLQLRQRLTERLDIPSERKIQHFSFFGLTSQANLQCETICKFVTFKRCGM